MKIVVYLTVTRREKALGELLLSGFRKHGDKVDVLNTHEHAGTPRPEYDLAVFIGVRTKSRRVYQTSNGIGQPTLMIDKGYFKRNIYHRFAVNGAAPWYLGNPRFKPSHDRLGSLGLTLKHSDAYRTGNLLVYVEATQKYYSFHHLGEVATYAAHVCGKLNEVLASRPDHGLKIVYRPKLCKREDKMGVHKPPKQPPNTLFSDPEGEFLSALFPRCRAVIVHGSNAGVEAMIAGVPVLSVGSAFSNPVHDLVMQKMEDVFTPFVPDDAAREQRLAELAWCQFDSHEIASGFAWEHLKPWVEPPGAFSAVSGRDPFDPYENLPPPIEVPVGASQGVSEAGLAE